MEKDQGLEKRESVLVISMFKILKHVIPNRDVQ